MSPIIQLAESHHLIAFELAAKRTEGETPGEAAQPSIRRSPIPFHPRRLAKAHPANANGTDASVKMNGSIMPT